MLFEKMIKYRILVEEKKSSPSDEKTYLLAKEEQDKKKGSLQDKIVHKK
jgi:hypothetical protein